VKQSQRYLIAQQNVNELNNENQSSRKQTGEIESETEQDRMREGVVEANRSQWGLLLVHFTMVHRASRDDTSAIG